MAGNLNGAVFEVLNSRVLEWGAQRGLHATKDPTSQFVKLTEELGELAAGIARDDEMRVIDAIGDMLVVMINLGAVLTNRYALTPDHCYTEETFLEEALGRAYAQISGRTGKTVNGVFLKDENQSAS